MYGYTSNEEELKAFIECMREKKGKREYDCLELVTNTKEYTNRVNPK